MEQIDLNPILKEALPFNINYDNGVTVDDITIKLKEPLKLYCKIPNNEGKLFDCTIDVVNNN